MDAFAKAALGFFRHRISGAVALVLFVSMGVAAYDTPLAFRWLAKEGPVEQVSHLVLVVGVGLWLAVYRRARSRRGFPLVAAAFLALLFLEETDWGAELGFVALSGSIRDLVGASNLHNSWGGHSYVLFALPIFLWFGATLLPERWRAPTLSRIAPYIPSRDARRAFWLVLAFAALTAPWEEHVQELSELLIYALLATPALDALRSRPGPPPRAS